MTVSTHSYSAVLVGSPDVPLALYEGNPGSIRLDVGSAPHVTANIVINPPGSSLLDDLTPTQSPVPRVRIAAAATFPAFSQSRAFNLSVRSWRVRQDDGRVELSLASDEALLGDFRVGVDDTAPLNFQSSLRALVNYVLNRALPGESLTISDSAPDVAVPALAASTNLIRNPRAGVNLTDWSVTWASGGVTMTRFASGGPFGQSYTEQLSGAGGATGAYVYLDETAISVTPGKLYELSVDVRASGSRQMTLDAILYDASGNIVAFATPVDVTPGGSFVRVSTSFYAVTNAVKVRPRVTPKFGLAGSEYTAVTRFRLSESTGDHARDILYFDGASAATAQYDYGWSDTAHASISTREPLIDAASPEALTWKAGQSALEFLAPIYQRFGLRLVCNETLQWTLRDEDYLAAGSLSVRYGINMTSGVIATSRGSGAWYDARVTTYRWTDASGAQQERVDYFELNHPPTLVDYLQVNSAYPGPGRSEAAVRRVQARQRDIEVSMVSDWTARAEQGVIVTVQGFAEQSGVTRSVTFDLGTDEVSLTIRAIDTPVGAIDLLAGSINGLTGSINSL